MSFIVFLVFGFLCLVSGHFWGWCDGRDYERNEQQKEYEADEERDS